MSRALRLHEKDNVATALADLTPGEDVTVEGTNTPFQIKAREQIPFGHKIALTLISPRVTIRKYGENIGKATRRILPGAHVHVHNLKSTWG